MRRRLIVGTAVAVVAASLWAVPALIDALKDTDVDVRLHATESLGELGDRRGLEPLMAAVKDENAGVRRQAIESLGDLGSDDREEN